MERDPLEHFIASNRSAFDQALPEHDLWSKIERQLPSEIGADTKSGSVVQLKRPRVFQLMKYAAAVLAIVSVSVFSTMEYMRSSNTEGISAEVMTELNELTDYYDFEVKRKLEQLAAYKAVPEINSVLSDIDKVIEGLKIELDEVPKGNEDKVINAMINNFQLKILILERMLEAKEGNFNLSENNRNEINI